MKKPHWVLICFIILFCAGCNESQRIPTQSNLPAGNLSSEMEEVPIWARPIQLESHIYTGLNLDGVGDADDEAYVSLYSWEKELWEEPFVPAATGITVLSVRLGTGETIAKAFPVFGHFSFYTGRLFSESKNAIVLEVQVPGSNYGAASVFAIDIFGTGEADLVPFMVEQLNTTAESVTLASGDELFPTGDVTDGTEIVDVRGQVLQGIRIYFTDSEAQWRGQQKIIYWSDGDWSLASE